MLGLFWTTGKHESGQQHLSDRSSNPLQFRIASKSEALHALNDSLLRRSCEMWWPVAKRDGYYGRLCSTLKTSKEGRYVGR